jgi:creatinine amidohydrolase/Fe(II)-dependent formamide hydrolase-like protein
VNVAKALSAEWAESGVRVHALTDYYQQGRILIRDYLQKTFGWSEQMVGSHAGTSDTSQLLYVYAQGIRTDKLAPNGGSADSGVNGDPTKATAEIGKIAIDFKVNAAIAQFRAAGK